MPSGSGNRAGPGSLRSPSADCDRRARIRASRAGAPAARRRLACSRDGAGDSQSRDRCHAARRATHAARLQKTPGLARDRSAVCRRKRRQLADAAAGSAVEAWRRHCDRRNRCRCGRREARGLRSSAGRDRHPRRARSDPRRRWRSQRSSCGRSLHRRARAVSGFAGAAGGSGCQRRGGPPSAAWIRARRSHSRGSTSGPSRIEQPGE